MNLTPYWAKLSDFLWPAGGYRDGQVILPACLQSTAIDRLRAPLAAKASAADEPRELHLEVNVNQKNTDRAHCLMAGLIVHEWIEKRGGAERVLDKMVEQFPDSDIACLWDDDPNRFLNNRVFESWMARTPLRRAKALALPLMSATWRSWRATRDYEWVLASSYVFAHHARFATKLGNPKKFVYVHTPARYIWAPELDPRGNSKLARAVSPTLKAIDRIAARDNSLLAANSEFVKERILLSWDRDARVIYPPVDVKIIQKVKNWGERLNSVEHDLLDSLPAIFLLGASRFVAYKGLDVVIAAGESVDLPVVIAGSGPLEDFLKGRALEAKIPVTIINSPSDNLLYALYQRALAYVFPSIEDFGIMPVEAMAAGCPVLVNAVGGTSETVIDGVCGFQLDRFDGFDLSSAVDRISSLDRSAIVEAALRFDAAYFQEELADWMGQSSPVQVQGLHQEAK